MITEKPWKTHKNFAVFSLDKYGLDDQTYQTQQRSRLTFLIVNCVTFCFKVNFIGGFMVGKPSTAVFKGSKVTAASRGTRHA